MKLLAPLLALFGAAQAAPPPLDVLALVEAVRQAEHSALDYVSPAGCRGVYQLSAGVWGEHSKQPHAWANSADRLAVIETKRVALKHAHWIVEKALPALNLRPSVYAAALIWRAGFGNVAKLNLTSENIDFARRVANLYSEP